MPNTNFLTLKLQYASWDLAFHMIPVANIDLQFAKEQLLLFLREWYMHPNGQVSFRYEPFVHILVCNMTDIHEVQIIFHKLL